MKKRTLRSVVLAAALTMVMSVPAHAGWWIHDEFGDMYVNDDGTVNFMKWFTDPETGYEYYSNPEGYVMKDAIVQSYYLDENGVKQEQTESGKKAVERAAAREAEQEKRGTPAKSAKSAKKAGAAAKGYEKKIALSTQRLPYQAELDVFLLDFHTELKKALKTAENKYEIWLGKDNYKTDYLTKAENGVVILTSAICKASNPKLPEYTEHAFEVNYNRDVAGVDAHLFDVEFKEVLLAALGENAGTALYDKVMAIAVGTDTQLNETGATDSGNTYVLKYRHNNANIKVTCSEIVPEETESEAVQAEADSTEAESVKADGTAQTDETAKADETTLADETSQAAE